MNDAEDTNADAAAPSPRPDDPSAADVPPDPGRRLVIEGNKAWTAAEVRRRWLPQLFARRAAPREVARFVASSC